MNKEVIEAYRAAHGKAKEKLRAEIVHDEGSFVRRCVMRFVYSAGVTGNSRELADLMQTATIGLLRALEKWQPARGSWRTTAWIWIRNELQVSLRKDALIRGNDTKRMPHELKEELLDAGMPVSGVRLSFVDDEDVFVGAEGDVDLLLDLKTALDDLRPSEHEAVWATLMYGETTGDVAARSGVTKQRIQQRRTKGLQELRERLAG